MRKPVMDVTWDIWNQILDTNLRGSFFMAQAVAHGMITRGYGRIVNMLALRELHIEPLQALIKAADGFVFADAPVAL